MISVTTMRFDLVLLHSPFKNLRLQQVFKTINSHQIQPHRAIMFMQFDAWWLDTSKNTLFLVLTSRDVKPKKRKKQIKQKN